MKSTAVLLILAVVLAGASAQFLPADQLAQEEEVGEEEESPGVSESEIERYIEVYKAMQANHALTIEEAVKPFNVTLEQFRAIERRIQKEQRYVDRVRKALLEYSRSQASTGVVPPDERRVATPKE
jgi:hypothetical protein